MSSPYAPTTSQYILKSLDASNLPNALQLLASDGLELVTSGSSYTMATTGNLNSLANMALGVSGIMRYDAGLGSTTACQLVSTNGSLVIENPTGVGGNPDFTVVNNTSTQRVIVAEAGTNKSNRQLLNFISGDGITVAVSDNGGAGRADITITSTGGGGGGAPDNATYILQTANGELADAQDLGSLSTGLLKSTTTTGVLSIAEDGTDYFGPASIVPPLSGGTGGANSPALGGLLIGNGAYFAVLGLGSEGTVLTSFSGTPAWRPSPSVDATYIVQAADASLPDAIDMASFSTGVVVNTNGTGLSVDTGALSTSLGGLGTELPFIPASCMLVSDSGGGAFFGLLNPGLNTQLLTIVAGAPSWQDAPSPGAPTTVKYIVQQASASLSAEQSLGLLTTGMLKNTVTGSTGVLSTAVNGTDYFGPGTTIAPTSGGTGQNSAAATGAILVGGGTNFAQLSIGSPGQVLTVSSGTASWATPSSSAPVGAKYIVQQADGTLTNEQSLGLLATGMIKNTTTTGVGVLSVGTNGTDYFGPGAYVPMAWGGTGSDLSGLADGAMFFSYSGAMTQIPYDVDGQYLQSIGGQPAWDFITIPNRVDRSVATVSQGNTSVTVTNGNVTAGSGVLTSKCSTANNVLDRALGWNVVCSAGSFQIVTTGAVNDVAGLRFAWQLFVD